MSDKPETIAAIIAEMCEAAKSTDLFNGEEVGEPLIRGTKVEEWADRIETAAELERNAHINDIHDALYKATGIPGNAAALREATIPSDEPSPRPWHTANFINGIEDANNGKVAANIRYADAALIVDAVNERDSLRDQLATALRLADECSRDAAAVHADRARAVEEAQSEANRRADRLADIVRRLSRHLANYITSESENDLLREARAAIGEDKP